MDYITIKNLKIFAHHGVFEQETENGQNFYVNAKLYVDMERIIASAGGARGERSEPSICLLPAA